MIVAGACGSDGGSGPSAGAVTSSSAAGAGACVRNEQGSGCLPTAPDSARVDLERPSFSDPARISNSRFPLGELTQVLQLGHKGGQPLRVEVTRLPGAKVVAWNGQPVGTVRSQFVAYLGGRIREVAIDYFAQADDGAVWHFGEDVTNYEDGVVADHDGTWLTGKDGPPGMIMPAAPEVGDVYRSENIPGKVFEQDTIRSTGETVAGPRGPVQGAAHVQELLMDGSFEEKAFAPGYGEFRAEAKDELVTVALAVPVDAAGGPVPAGLATLAGGRDPARAGQAALRVEQAALDLQLRYRAPAVVDLDRLDLWARQLLLDAAAGDRRAVAGDAATLQFIWDRAGHGAEAGAAERVTAGLTAVGKAAAGKDVSAAAAAIPPLRTALAGLTP